jgi:hypothetical protein
MLTGGCRVDEGIHFVSASTSDDINVVMATPVYVPTSMLVLPERITLISARGIREDLSSSHDTRNKLWGHG